MPRMRWSVGAKAEGCPAIEASGSSSVDAVSTVEIPVEAGTTPTADLQAGDAAEVALLLVTASRYDTGVSYELGGRTLTLDQPHFFGGAMVGELFGDGGDLDQLEVAEPGPTADVTITVLVGRSAVDADDGE